MAKRSYSDSDKATALAALDANAGNVNRTAKQVGIPRGTLIEWQNGRVSDDVSDIRQVKKKSLADCAREIAFKLIDIPEADIAATAVEKRMTSFGIAVDKIQLLEGKPTAINENRVGENKEWAEQQIAEMMKEFDLTREKAIELAKQNAPTIAEWVM